jgi:hypothetical protein
LIEGAEGLGALGAEVDVSIDIFFDERHIDT